MADNTEILRLLDQIEHEEAVRATQARARGELRRVIEHYKFALGEIPRLEAAITAKQKDIQELEERHRNQLAGIHKTRETAQREATEVVARANNVAAEARMKITEMEANVEKITETTNVKLVNLEKALREMETALEAAQQRYDKFKAALV